MIDKLQIRNYAIIDELDISFTPGLNIITGETGAGKSILMGALNLVLASGPIRRCCLMPAENALWKRFQGEEARQDQPFLVRTTWMRKMRSGCAGKSVRMANREALLTTHRSIFHNSGR